MSLTGNLEDLPLLDILQIVSFSKKTGFLSIEAEIGHGAIVFDQGFVVAAFTWETPPLDPRAQALLPAKRDVILRGRIEMALEQLIRLREGMFNFSLTDHVPFDVAGRDIEFELAEPRDQRAGAPARPRPRHGRGPPGLHGGRRGVVRGRRDRNGRGPRRAVGAGASPAASVAARRRRRRRRISRRRLCRPARRLRRPRPRPAPAIPRALFR